MQDDLIALSVAVHIVVRLERIEIEIGDDAASTTVDQTIDTAAHGAVAGQQREWIRMLRRLQLLLGDQSQQVDRLTETEIPAVLRDHEFFGEPRAALLRDEPAD